MSGQFGTKTYVNRADEIRLERQKKGGVSGGKGAKRRPKKGK